MSHRSRFLLFILAFYLLFGALYALFTPAWETPDEPAHFNYVRFIAENGALPVLQTGDYDQAYLDAIKAAKFPPTMSIDSIRYTSHHPPLYYLLATPIYLIAKPFGLIGTMLALRFFSLALGGIVLLLAYRILTEIFTNDSLLVFASVGLMATVPMHIALTAAVNNDTLAQVVGAVILFIAVRRAQGKLSARAFIVLGGIAYALALVTKETIYATAILFVGAELIYRRALSRPVILALLYLFGLSILLSAPWFIRNALTYGATDLFGWARHDAVVVGQPTTAEWIARYGLKNVFADFFIITFKSFWAQFGWMGVLVNDRIYVGLFVLTGIALFGLALWAWRVVRNRNTLTGEQWRGVILLALLFVAIFAEDAWYNLKFVQPQGRYLFPALIPIALFLVIGLRESLSERHQRIVFILLYLGMLAFDYVSLFWFIIPQLRG